MKTHRKSNRPTTIALALAAGLLAGAIIPSSPLLAQAATPAGASANAKIQLFSDAVTAQQNGDLAKAGGDLAKANSDYAQAKDLFGQIIAMDPTDPGNKDIQIRMAQLDQMMGSAQGAPAAGGAMAAASSAPAAAPASSKSAAGKASAEASSELQIQAEKQKSQMAIVAQDIAAGMASDKAGNYDDARAKLAKADAELPPGIASNSVHAAIGQDVANTWYHQTVAAINTGDFASAQADIKTYQDNGGNAKDAQALKDNLAKAQADPRRQPVDPAFQAKQDTIKQLLIQAEAEYFYGDYNDAQSVFNQVIINDPNNIPAQAFEKKISEVLQSSSSLPHDSVRLQMLTDVDNEWRRPAAFSGTPGAENNKTVLSPDIKKLSEIIIPRVDIDVPTPLDDVITTLTVLSRTYDKDNKGLNFHVEPPSNGQPMPKIKLRELNDVSLQKLLDMACQDANYGYYDDNGVIQVAQGAAGGASTSLSRSYQTKSFPMTDATLTRLLGVPPSGDSSSSGAADNTFSSTGGGSSSGSSDSSAPTSSDTESRLKAFFQRSGIDFPNGSQVSYASPNIYVTNTPKNLEALGTFLKQFSTVKQAEIETRFLDVNQGDLQELGFNWNVANPTNGGQQQNFLRTTDLNGSNNNRDLGTAFPLGNSGANPTIVAGLSTSTLQPVEIPDGLGGFLISDQTVTTALPNLTIPQSIPTLPNEVNVGETATTAFSGVVSWLQGYRINMIINALDQKQGSDLMSAPKIVVMDQHDATITIAQQLRYPDTFSPIQSTVSPASNNSNGGGGSGGVTITAGTPNGFETANIGVDMEVTPHIYEDQTIEMHLQPTVTEFEGFIEYGGTSLAIQSGTTASVPSGFIQPIFDVRKIETDVTIFDGATVILGGLTRDEVKTVDDKVPVLGDLPLIGRLFQSKGETSQKRNLMIFVTANIISPGGAPANQSIQNITPGSVFQNPTIVTPNRSIPRQPDHPLAPSDTAAQ